MRIHLQMLIALTAGISFVAAGVRGETQPGVEEALAAELEELARDLTHFSRTVVVRNRELRSRVMDGESFRGSDILARRQLDLRERLQALSEREGLQDLLKHSDPKVRTLALGVIFQREDPADLPSIASLIDDGASTFPDLHNSMSSAPGARPMSELESPQSVGEVAQAMLAWWGVPSLSLMSQVTVEDFERYWERFQGRDRSADWFLFKMNRATRRGSPLRPEFHDDVERVVAEINALPTEERAWTRLFVHVGSFPDLEAVMPEKTHVQSLKAVGPAELLRFLEREPVSDDPALWFDDPGNARGRLFGPMAHFIVRRPNELLRPEDAQRLLACEERERDAGRTGVVTPWWAAAAAELMHPKEPAEAAGIVDEALGRFPLDRILGGRNQAVLMGAMWRMNGMRERQRLVDWFYEAQGLVLREGRDASNHGPTDFLRFVEQSERAETSDLVAALAADERFHLTDWPVLRVMLEIANAKLEQPLVSREEMFEARRGDNAEALARWRQLLRDHFVLNQIMLQPQGKGSASEGEGGRNLGQKSEMDFAILKEQYAGRIDTHVRGPARVEVMRALGNLMQEWNPVGHSRGEEVISLMGSPTHESDKELVYIFDSGRGGPAWRFYLESNLVVRVEPFSVN